MTPSEECYYRAIERDCPVLVLLGEESERWTGAMIDALHAQAIAFDFFPWDAVPDVRMQSDVVRYPVLQLWVNGSLEEEMSGFQPARLRSIIKRFVFKRRG